MVKLCIQKQNEPMSSLTHLIGLILSIAGLVLLVVFASLKGTVWHIVGFSIFGASLVLLYLASTLYHFFCITKKVKEIFRRIDHSMIYVLIAGTYTPLCLVTLRGPWGWSLFGVIWGIAVLGIIIKSTMQVNDLVSTVLYVLMGWLVVVVFYPLVKAISIMAFFWLLLGGFFYTVGTIFFIFDPLVKRTKWWGMHEIFHLFVIAGSFCHFWLMFWYLL